MIDRILAKTFGTKHEREVKAMRPIIAAISELEPKMQALSDQDWPLKPSLSANNWHKVPRSTIF